MRGERLDFSIVNPSGEVLLQGHLLDPVDSVLVVDDFQRCATEEDIAFLRQHLHRELPGYRDLDWWVPALGTLEDASNGDYLVAWAPALKQLHDERREALAASHDNNYRGGSSDEDED